MTLYICDQCAKLRQGPLNKVEVKKEETDEPQNWFICESCSTPLGIFAENVATVTFSPPNTTNIQIDNTESGAKPKDKRVIRTKSTGDRVYLIDETAKTKAWVTSSEILEKLGFSMADVEEVDDSSLVGYAMTASVYKVD